MPTPYSYEFDGEAFNNDARSLSGDERRVYWQLLDLAIRSSHGGIPADDEDGLRHQLDFFGRNRHRWQSTAVPMLEKFFTLSPDGYWRQKRALATRFKPIIDHASRGKTPRITREMKRKKVNVQRALKDVAQHFIDHGWDGYEESVIDAFIAEVSPPPTDKSTIADDPDCDDAAMTALRQRYDSAMSARPRRDERTEKTVEKQQPLFESFPKESRLAPAPAPAIPLSPLEGDSKEDEFEEFWKAYPTTRNMSKQDARSKYLRARKGYRERDGATMPPVTAERILDACKAYAAECRSEKREGQHIKHAQGWLSGRRWEGYEPKPKSPEERTPEQHVDSWLRGADWPDHLGPSPEYGECVASAEHVQKAASMVSDRIVMSRREAIYRRFRDAA